MEHDNWIVPDGPPLLLESPPSLLRIIWWRLRLWLGRPWRCKLGFHASIDFHEMSYGFRGMVDYHCSRCQHIIKSIAIDDLAPKERAIVSDVIEMCSTGEEHIYGA